MLWLKLPLDYQNMFLCQYWQSNRSIKWHESALDCVRPEPPSVDYYGYQQTSQAILWDGLQKSREVAAAASMAQEGDNCGKKWRSFVSRSTGSAVCCSWRNTEQPSPVQARPVSWKLISNYGSLIHTAVFSHFFFFHANFNLGRSCSKDKYCPRDWISSRVSFSVFWTKGQLISKWNFNVFNSPKNGTWKC